jgi:hypothetical protein
LSIPAGDISGDSLGEIDTSIKIPVNASMPIVLSETE